MDKDIIVINSIEDVQPVRVDVSDIVDDLVQSNEGNAHFTMIKCTGRRYDTNEQAEVILLLPRGDEACKNTYLLADAIRDE